MLILWLSRIELDNKEFWNVCNYCNYLFSLLLAWRSPSRKSYFAGDLGHHDIHMTSMFWFADLITGVPQINDNGQGNANAFMEHSGSAWSSYLQQDPFGGSLGPVLKRFMSWWSKSHQNTFYCHFDCMYPIRSELCTYHDSRAVVICAQFCPDWVMICSIITDLMFRKLGLCGHNQLVRCATYTKLAYWYHIDMLMSSFGQRHVTYCPKYWHYLLCLYY